MGVPGAGTRAWNGGKGGDARDRERCVATHPCRDGNVISLREVAHVHKYCERDTEHAHERESTHCDGRKVKTMGVFKTSLD